jgi:NAD(P)-dependent dehydrogenase (short-subunit alcohol dehydrogenase family)
MSDSLDRIPGLLGDALVLVTGAGQGNGRAIALGVATAGAKVIVTDVRQDTAQSTADEIQARGTCKESSRRGRFRQCPGEQCRDHYSRDDR